MQIATGYSSSASASNLREIDPTLLAKAAKKHAKLDTSDSPGHPEEPAKDGFWKDFGHDLRDLLLNIDHERIDDFARFIKSVGNPLKDGWKFVRDIPDKVLNHPIISDKMAEKDRTRWLDLGGEVATIAGFTAAGGFAIAGALKMASGAKVKNWGGAIDGLIDVVTGASVALAVAGLAGAGVVLAPIAASINAIKGGYNTASGFRHQDERKQLQGVLDLTRSAGTLGRLLRNQAPALKVMGIALAPVAGGIQAWRGVHDVSIGLKNKDHKKELQGLVDIATALGTGLAFASGFAVIPGVALAVAANAVKVGYQLSPRIRKRVDKLLDRHQSKLEKLVAGSDRLSAPVKRIYSSIMSRLIEQDPQAPDHYSKAKLAEVINLLQADGRFSRQEHDRFSTSLEEVGQKKDLPKRTDLPPKLKRQELLNELKGQEAKIEFIRFLLVAANYDYLIKPEEIEFVHELAVHKLNITDATFNELLEEQQKKRIVSLV